MSATERFFVADREDERTVQFERVDRGPSGRRAAHNAHTVEGEMVLPAVAARMEQRRLRAGLGIGRGLSRCLAQGAGDARQRQVFFAGWPARSNRNHMIDVEGCFLACLGQTAILATITCPLGSRASEPGGYHAHGATLSSLCQALGAQTQQGEEFRDIDKAFGLPALVRREGLPSVLAVQQMLEPSGNAFRQAKTW